MSTNINPLDDSQFDRLVDNELSETERHALLGRLDREPGGWRQCALAFLEAQCWKQAFAPRSESVTPAQSPIEKSDPRPSRRYSGWTKSLGTGLAMAASFLLAFWIGSLVHRGHAPLGGTGDQVAAVRPQPIERQPQVVGQSPAAPWRVVSVSDRDGQPGRVRLPAVERSNVDQAWIDSLPSAIPDDVRQAFGRSGHEIQQHRQVIPVQLNDGRRFVMPVDQVDVHYIGNGTY